MRLKAGNMHLFVRMIHKDICTVDAVVRRRVVSAASCERVQKILSIWTNTMSVYTCAQCVHIRIQNHTRTPCEDIDMTCKHSRVDAIIRQGLVRAVFQRVEVLHVEALDDRRHSFHVDALHARVHACILVVSARACMHVI